MKYRTKDGDVLDAVCTKHYGDLSWRIEDVIAANPGLSARGAVLPSGLLIELPPVEDAAPQRPTLRLWG
ncbi:tail protein X [Ruegeria sp. 2012CJ41-6]|uniref:Tail protein X n=1 Tax=Ruegeria spongiae TaxID=2942209 RepID=A0ABT0Q4G3_9RHOB|nr:tail protein X [Ruegeria spongiae]MCL6284705.1 tail protein X [Ruegeria spongiae]